MKASELVAQLQALINEHRDQEVEDHDEWPVENVRYSEAQQAIVLERV